MRPNGNSWPPLSNAITNVPRCLGRNRHHLFNSHEAEVSAPRPDATSRFLACTLVIGVTGSASAGQAQDEAAIRALGDNFAKAFVQKNAEQ